MNLSKLSTKYGAAMGRTEYHDRGAENLTFELEWVPFVDGCYDAGGAYWGAPDNLYCAESQGVEEVRFFVRASSRKEAIVEAFKLYPNAVIRPENGSLIKQTIAFLEEYQAGLAIEDEQLAEETWQEIDDLQSLLDEKGLP